MTTLSDRRQDFLWIVQMIMNKYADVITGWSGISGDAVAASYRIPPNMTARTAALEFCAFFIDSFRGEGVERVCPSWMSGLPDPTYSKP